MRVKKTATADSPAAKKPRAPEDNHQPAHPDSSHDSHLDTDIIDETVPADDATRQLLMKHSPGPLEALGLFASSPLLHALFIDAPDPFLATALPDYVRAHHSGPVTTVEAADITDIPDTIRRACTFSLRATVDVFEGEVTDIRILRPDPPDSDPDVVELALRTSRETLPVRLSKYMAQAIAKLNVGDVVRIEPTAGLIRRIGRSESCASEYDLEGDKYVPLGKAPVHTTRDYHSALSLHDVDCALSGPDGPLSAFVRMHSDRIMEEYCRCSIAEQLRGLLVIQQAHWLSPQQIEAIVDYSGTLARTPAGVKVLLVGEATGLRGGATGLRGGAGRMPLVRFASLCDDGLDPLEILSLRHRGLARYSECVRRYISDVSLSIISDILDISADPADFGRIMEMYLQSK